MSDGQKLTVHIENGFKLNISFDFFKINNNFIWMILKENWTAYD